MVLPEKPISVVNSFDHLRKKGALMQKVNVSRVRERRLFIAVVDKGPLCMARIRGGCHGKANGKKEREKVMGKRRSRCMIFCWHLNLGYHHLPSWVQKKGESGS
jgi:hypothetical protein